MVRLKSSFACWLILFLLLFTEKVKSQSIPSLKADTLTLQDLSQFKPLKGGNWVLAANISADRNEPQELLIKKGKGILVYLPKQKGSKTIQTKLVHGDIDLDLDFLLSKSASFEVLLQGKYKVEITDSWLEKNRSAIKAPGLWQHLSIQFKAPVFDANGKKIQDARFEKILVNNQPIRTLPNLYSDPERTLKDEKRNAGTAIKGKNTSFAIRNVRYKAYKKEEIRLSEIRFAVYNGLHKTVDTLKTLKPKRTGYTDTLSHRVGDRKSQLVFEGLADIPADGNYLFRLTAGGGAWLFIDGKLMVENRGSRDFEKPFYAEKTLKKGKYPFKIVYSNSDECLVIHYEGPQIPWHSLTTMASVRLSEKFDPLEYKVKNKPVLQRGFMLLNGLVNPYIAAVGLPDNTGSEGLNYAYDMKNYALSAVWHGKYIDVSNMWTERGEKQLEIPLGAKLNLSQKPLLSKNLYENQSWPDSVALPEGVYQNRGYRLNTEGFPQFYYALGAASVEDLIYPNNEKSGLTRVLKITNPSERYYCLLGEGKTIEKLDDGSFTIDDKNYYISNLEAKGLKVSVAHGLQGDKLYITLAPQKEPVTIKYDMIW